MSKFFQKTYITGNALFQVDALDQSSSESGAGEKDRQDEAIVGAGKRIGS